MANWEFDILPASLVEQELTQRDQFNNDDVALTEALVREVIQNSYDAADSEKPVKVRFEFQNLDDAKSKNFHGLFATLKLHLIKCEIDDAPLNQPQARVLIIEDFNTNGLTGRYDALDEDNFRNFWRRHGKSGKGGRSGGRWGLGKLVFSSSSQIHAFFGVTFRKGDASPLLMGQAVLTNHVLNGKRHPAHGFWFENRTADNDELQLPITDNEKIKNFCALAGISRTNQPGLSIAIPYVDARIDEDGIVSGVVNNHYFPILAGRLVVEVGSNIIDHQSFHEIAATSEITSVTHVPFNFVEEISKKIKEEPDAIAKKPVGNQELNTSSFCPKDLEAIKQLYAEGYIVHVRVPVTLRPKEGTNKDTSIDLYLKMLPEGEKSYALYARGQITLPSERRYFSGSPAFGALVANEDDIAAFLGDAENPAHTGWNANAEKLAAKWRNPSQTLGHIRHSLKKFHDLVADQIETKDPDALIDFFSLMDHSQSAKGKKKRTSKPNPNPKTREKALLIKPRKGGFEIVAGPSAVTWSYPKKVRVRMAYDMIGANPFNRHSIFDFDLTKNDVNLDAEDAEIHPIARNVFILNVTSNNFHLKVWGFDENRDIVVDARALS